MTTRFEEPRAPGGDGTPSSWTRGGKDAVGTSYTRGSPVWYTSSDGALDEIYYPTIDRPQIRSLQYLVTDGKSFLHRERTDLVSETDYLDEHALGIRTVNRDPAGRYRIVKTVIGDPDRSAILLHTRLEPGEAWRGALRLFAHLEPHLGGDGRDDSAYAIDAAGRLRLAAGGGGIWVAMGASIPFVRSSVGYVGSSDGLTALSEEFDLRHEYRAAPSGHVALTAELDLTAAAADPAAASRTGVEFVLALGFGTGAHHAATVLEHALSAPFEHPMGRFVEHWRHACRDEEPLAAVSGDGGSLLHRSHSLLLAHEDKAYPGAVIASLSIPWGEARGDEELGGYHLVWPRDMVNSAGGLLAVGRRSTPLRALVHLACSQRLDGGFYQNEWLDGSPYWQGVQLDETSFPILLAWRLHVLDALASFDPWPMIRRAAGYLAREGPATAQERWEENGGYSPSTLAANIAALICAAGFARDRGEEELAEFLEEYADFLAFHIEHWTVTERGTLHPEIPRHFVRINPVEPGAPDPDVGPDEAEVTLANQPPGAPARYPARDIVDAGFIHLVRFGIRPAGDPLIEDSLRVVDHVLRTETPFGPGWHRYNHDGYGQRDDGGPYQGWGRGRIWPLLTGERGHYELAAGRDPGPFIRAMEGFATATGLLPEQAWDGPDLPEAGLRLGRPTGSAMPLAWAHAEYIKLLRSARDGRVFDFVPAVADRYLHPTRCRRLEIWKFNRRVTRMPAGWTLRIMARAPFILHHTRADHEEGVESWPAAASRDTGVDIHHADIEATTSGAPIVFTFFWPEVGRWEGETFRVAVEEEG